MAPTAFLKKIFTYYPYSITFFRAAPYIDGRKGYDYA